MSNKVLAKDGKYYDSFIEASAASDAWEEQQSIQKEQNKLLKQQNNLLRQQTIANRKLQEEKLKQEKELEIERINREEEKEIKKLFDKLGISYKLYKSYANKLFNSKELKDLSDKISSSSYQKELANFLLEGKYSIYNVTNEDQRDDLRDLRDSIENRCKTDEKRYDNQIDELKVKRKLHIIIDICLFVIATIFSAIGVSINNDNMFGLFMLLYIIAIVYLIVVVAIYNSKIENLKKINNNPNIDYEKYNKELEKIISKEETNIKKYQEREKTIIEENLKEFTDFRLNHYNKDIEKLLVDCKFREEIESYDIKYPIVNINNKKNEGTIEEYIAFFEENI